MVAWAALVGLSLAGERVAARPWLERVLLGGAFGFGYHLAGLWWIGAAFLVDLDTFGPFLPLGVVGLPLILAPFDALALLLTGLAPRTAGWRVVALSLSVAATEAVRGVAFTGFPWNVPAVELSGSVTLVQAAAVLGVDGLAVPVVLIGAAPAALFVRGSRWAAALGVAALAALAGYGTLRLAAPPPADTGARVRIVQTAVPQEEKFDPSAIRDLWSKLLAMTAMPGADGTVPTVVVWPETAFPFLYDGTGVAAQDLATVLDGRTLVSGAAVVADGTAYNSMFAVGPDGTIGQRYDKLHLVPFGEYLPFAGVLARLGLKAVVEEADRFSPGNERRPFVVPGLPPALPLICYEAIFPVATGAVGLVVNVTNDAWFGDTPGPRQHLRQVQLRAIESGLPVLRAANNGISAVIDATGRVRGRVAINHEDVLDIAVPGARRTFASVYGDVPLVVLCVSAVAAAFVFRARRRVRTR